MKSEALYFRSSPELRQAADEFASTRGLTLSSGIAVLVERGLEAVASEDSVKALEATSQQLRQEVAVLRERDQKWTAVFSSLQGQLQALPIGHCPVCRRDVTAFDQMVTRRCPWLSCGRPLERVERAADVSPALAGLLGAIGGLVLGLAASQGSRPTS